MTKQKHAIVTFKAEASLMEALRGLPNRSAFIRSAILAALDNTCPLCRGSGILTQEQKTHWNVFALGHAVQECDECHEWYLVCSHESAGGRHGR